MSIVTLVPSYGRDYTSHKEVQTAWDNGKDFTIYQIFHPYDGKKINKKDAEFQGGTFSVRFSSKTKQHIIVCAKK